MDIMTAITIALGVISVGVSVFIILLDAKLTKTEKLAKIKTLLPDILVKVEDIFGAKNGSVKKEYALVEAQKLCIANHLKLDDKLITDLDKDIESILTTPQKKPNVTNTEIKGE